MLDNLEPLLFVFLLSSIIISIRIYTEFKITRDKNDDLERRLQKSTESRERAETLSNYFESNMQNEKDINAKLEQERTANRWEIKNLKNKIEEYERIIYSGDEEIADINLRKNG